MEQIILIVHLLLALAIIGLIMLQQGKGADVGASFGAGASQTLFGSDGSGNVLTRATAWLAAAFFATSFGLALIASERSATDNIDDLGLPIEDVVRERRATTTDLPERAPEENDVPVLDASGADAQGAPEEPVGDVPTLD